MRRLVFFMYSFHLFAVLFCSYPLYFSFVPLISSTFTLLFWFGRTFILLSCFCYSSSATYLKCVCFCAKPRNKKTKIMQNNFRARLLTWSTIVNMKIKTISIRYLRLFSSFFSVAIVFSNVSHVIDDEEGIYIR